MQGNNDNNRLPAEFILALDVTTYFGVFCSLMGLILLLLTYLIFKLVLHACITVARQTSLLYRDFRQKDISKFHVQLAVSLMLMLIVFMAGIDRTENRAGCIIVGVLLHYLILVAWMWMGAEAVLLFQKLVIVFKKSTTLYIVIVSIVCWGEQHKCIILIIIKNFFQLVLCCQ